MHHASERGKKKGPCLLWINHDYNADCTPLPLTHEQQRNMKGVDHEEIPGWEEKGAMCITRTDRGGEGVSWGMSRKERKRREKGFNCPSQLWRVNTWMHMSKWSGSVSEWTNAHGRNHVRIHTHKKWHINGAWTQTRVSALTQRPPGCQILFV